MTADHPDHWSADRSTLGVARVNGTPNGLLGLRLDGAYVDEAVPRIEDLLTAGTFRAQAVRTRAEAVLGDQAALALVDELLAAGEYEQAEAVVRLVVAGMPPPLVDARMAALAVQLGRVALATAFHDAASTLPSLLDTLPDAPPDEPRARALWLRQHRNTGPQHQRRAPRAITPRRHR